MNKKGIITGCSLLGVSAVCFSLLLGLGVSASGFILPFWAISTGVAGFLTIFGTMISFVTKRAVARKYRNSRIKHLYRDLSLSNFDYNSKAIKRLSRYDVRNRLLNNEYRLVKNFGETKHTHRNEGNLDKKAYSLTERKRTTEALRDYYKSGRMFSASKVAAYDKELVQIDKEIEKLSKKQNMEIKNETSIVNNELSFIMTLTNENQEVYDTRNSFSCFCEESVDDLKKMFHIRHKEIYESKRSMSYGETMKVEFFDKGTGENKTSYINCSARGEIYRTLGFDFLQDSVRYLDHKPENFPVKVTVVSHKNALKDNDLNVVDKNGFIGREFVCHNVNDISNLSINLLAYAENVKGIEKFDKTLQPLYDMSKA